MPRHRARQVVGSLVRAALEQLGVGADGGERRAQLVRGVGDEAPQAPVGGLDPVEHRVQGEPEAADLGARLGPLDPVREVTGRDLVGRPADRAPADAGRGARSRGRAGRSPPSTPSVTNTSIRSSRWSVPVDAARADVAITTIALDPGSIDARTR